VYRRLRRRWAAAGNESALADSEFLWPGNVSRAADTWFPRADILFPSRGSEFRAAGTWSPTAGSASLALGSGFRLADI